MYFIIIVLETVNKISGNGEKKQKKYVKPLTDTLNLTATDHYTAIRWLVHWPLMGGLLHVVQRGGAWVGCLD